MSITDELRSWAARRLAGWKMLREEHDELTAIADRIDAEHEAMLADVRKTVYQGLIELPKDADGEYIHVGDVMEPNGANSLFGQASFEVRAMRYDEGGWEVYDRLGDRYAPSLLRHHYAPTVEDVLREFALKAAGKECMTMRSDLVDEYASKLQLREDA